MAGFRSEKTPKRDPQDGRFDCRIHRCSSNTVSMDHPSIHVWRFSPQVSSLCLSPHVRHLPTWMAEVAWTWMREYVCSQMSLFLSPLSHPLRFFVSGVSGMTFIQRRVTRLQLQFQAAHDVTKCPSKDQGCISLMETHGEANMHGDNQGALHIPVP